MIEAGDTVELKDGRIVVLISETKKGSFWAETAMKDRAPEKMQITADQIRSTEPMGAE